MPDKKRTPRPLGLAECADKIAQLLNCFEERRAEAEAAARREVLAATQAAFDRLVYRCPEESRSKLPALLAAMGASLGELRIVEADEAPPTSEMDEPAELEPVGVTPYEPGPAAKAALGRTR